MKKGLVPARGLVTEGPLAPLLDVAPLDQLVFGGWDLRPGNAYDAAIGHEVVQRHLLDEVRDELTALEPWPAIASSRFLRASAGDHRLTARTAREELALLERDVRTFAERHRVDRLVMVNLTSTESYSEIADVHRTLKAFEAGLDRDDERISPAMKYAYLACTMGIPHVNFTPSLTLIPALLELAERNGVPLTGEDGKTGQTFLKTVLAPALAIRQLHVDGWFSTNILGNNDGLVLSDPGSNKTKVTSKQRVLDGILGYPVENHQVHIHYYKPRGDAKQAWDNIDISGFLGEQMQIKVDFLCKDSILAAPLVLDLVRLIDLAKRSGECGIQRQLSVFFKSPYHTPGEQPVHNLFQQHALLVEWIQHLVGPNSNGKNGHPVDGSRSAEVPSKGQFLAR